ncbi:peptide ABC transporter substrate-binding protein [Kineosporia babensis]|uniref:Peptide ABC transporter substrate-binding protein n=1 Tax=Kineosporia babensis TaxID=499548 RepID=A0A9X1SVR1_9ACTN|nr:peptide ABC transporter substrate-binding protein [Kineosporia babensis]MCD5313946.1 peptide ABC transporter substrate-binding protein [Kineosporia babensis]
MFGAAASPFRRRVLPVSAALVAAGVVLAGCSGSGDEGSSGSNSSKTSVNYALPPNTTPNWILPLSTAGHMNTNNISIANSLWPQLISYDGSTGSIAWNKESSLASEAVFADDAKSVTITLAERTWSDGTPVTSRDVEFWYNLVTVNKADWAPYTEGKAPDNFTGFETVDEQTFTITFDKAYNTEWMLANQLTKINPLPHHAWAKDSDDAETGDEDRDAAGAKKIWDYLISKAEDMDGYATDEIWKTVSGPYTISSFDSNGKVVLEANAKYDGAAAPAIKTVNLLPFTSSAAATNAVRSGQVDYGYISASDMDQEARFTQLGYEVQPWSGWSITYMPYNFNNPTMGKVFAQPYARQAIQRSIDQTSLSEVIWSGTASPLYGPVPQGQESDFISDEQKANPYPFDTTAAQKLLTDNGWEIGSDGIAVCADAGSAAGQCGEGVEAGTKFEMKVLAQSGSEVTDNMMAAIKSDLAKTGIGFTVESAPVNTVLSRTGQCEPSDSACDWQLSFFGTAGSWYFPAYPTGESLFASDGGSNFGSYDNAEVDELIDATTSSADPDAIKQYSAALAADLPVIWLPSPDYQVSVVKKGLTGFSQDSLANFHPATWSWS